MTPPISPAVGEEPVDNELLLKRLIEDEPCDALNEQAADRIKELEAALTEIRDGYQVQHTSKWAKNFAAQALDKGRGG